MRFTKMQGIGNDYLLINCFEEYVPDPSRLAVEMCREHVGVGADGIVLLEPGESSPFAMRIFNRDGSEAEMCGNAARCIGKFVYERGMTADTAFSLDTRSGIRALQLQVQDGRVESVTVDMGTPVLNPSEIPVDLPGQMVLRHRLQVLGQMWFITCVSMGNPHCVIFVRDPEVLDLNSIGPAFEHYSLFPRRTNVEFVRVISRDVLQMRVWERGSGETWACGTGACAAVCAAVENSFCDAETDVRVRLRGGELTVRVGADRRITMEGDAVRVYDGIYDFRG